MSAPMVLIIQHAEAEAMGILELLCREMGIAWHLCRPYSGEIVPPATQPYHGLIILGGPMNADEIDRYPFLKDEVRLIQQAFRRQLPTLGICLGAQLMAKAAGSRVYKGPEEEVGWAPIRLTAEGQTDPIFSGIPQEVMTFHWHGDTYDLPAKAVHLAGNDRYAQQAFRIGEKAYALQCHFEVTPEIVDRWAGETSSHDPAPIRDGIARYGESFEKQGREILGRFLQMVAAYHAEKKKEEE